jgi:hypothetical protein
MNLLSAHCDAGASLDEDYVRKIQQIHTKQHGIEKFIIINEFIFCSDT